MTSAAIDRSSASRRRSSPVISQSIQTRRRSPVPTLTARVDSTAAAPPYGALVARDAGCEARWGTLMTGWSGAPATRVGVAASRDRRRLRDRGRRARAGLGGGRRRRWTRLRAVRIPLAMLNRHGLVAGATGTGKTKTLQLILPSSSRPRACRCCWPTSRATCRVCRRRARRSDEDRPRGRRVDRPRLGRRRRSPCEFLSLGAGRGRRRSGATMTELRAAAAVQGAGAQRDAGVDARADLPLGRQPGPARCST